MKRTTLLIRLLRNGMKYRYCRLTGASCRPQAISLEVTHFCMGRCMMCNIWRIPASVKDLSLESWFGLLRSSMLRDLREIDITGGEPFLRKDLARLLEGIAYLSGRQLRRLRGIAVTTNGYLTERILDVAAKVLPPLQEKNLDLVFACAMDGIGEVHDRIRGVREIWARQDATIAGLCRLRENYPNLVIGLKTTVLPPNIPDLERIADYADSRGLFTIVSPCIFTENRYDNLDKERDICLSGEDWTEFGRFLRSERFRWNIHRRVLLDYIERGLVEKPCTAGFNYFFVRSTGEVYPCPLIPNCIGSLRDQGFDRMLGGEKAKAFRRKVRGFPQCRVCTEPGLERYALPFEGFSYAKRLLRMEAGEFESLHAHMGLGKYLD